VTFEEFAAFQQLLQSLDTVEEALNLVATVKGQLQRGNRSTVLWAVIDTLQILFSEQHWRPLT